MAKPLVRSRSFKMLVSNSDSPKESTHPASRRLQKTQRPRDISPMENHELAPSPKPRKLLMRSRSQGRKDLPQEVGGPSNNSYAGVNPLASHTSSMFFAPAPQVAVDPPPYEAYVEMPIGMALGSPRDNPYWLSEQPLPTSASDNTNGSKLLTTISSPVSSQNSDDKHHGGSTLKHKGSRWKVLGMFGKRSADPPPPSSLRQTNDSPSEPQSSAMRPPQITRKRSIRITASPRYRHEEEAKPNFKRAQTAPSSQAECAPRPPPKNTQASLRPAGFHLGAARMLDIDIPDTKLDRYSVMFDAVLKPAQPPSQPRSSLLARRQATLGTLKPLDGAELDNNPNYDFLLPSRRATTPSPTKSPSFQIFPPDPATSFRNLSPSPYAARRAVTAPNAVFPLRHSSEPNKTPESESHIILMVHSPAKESYDEPLRVVTRNPSYDRSLPSSPQSFDTAASYFHDAGKENSWKVLPKMGDRTLPRSPGSAGAEGEYRLERYYSGTAVQFTLADSGSDTIAEALINSAAEKSIARQISVSQRQRLLLPVMPKAERIIDRQPKLVELRQGKSRKSQHLEIQRV